MKRFVIVLSITASGFLAKGQWTTNIAGDAVNNNSSGRVGIGTTSPTQKLEVNGSILGSSENSSFGIDTGSGSRLGIIKKYGFYPLFASDVSSPIVFAQSNQTGIQTNISGATLTERMRIDVNGNVGIGTSTPLFPLHVASSTPAAALFKSSITGNTDNISIVNASNYGYGVVGVVSGTGVQGGDVYGLGYDSNGGTAFNNVLNWTSSGYVGIGTSTPNYKLHVMGSIVANATNNSLGLTTNWAASPNGALAALQSSSAYIYFSANGKYSGFLGGTTTDATFGLNSGSGNTTVTLNTNGTSYLTGGNVGIGTTSPDALLAVKGQIHANEVKVDINVPGPDYVFEKDYQLTSLEDIKTYIDQNKHLPEVPSAEEMEKNGVQLGEMNMLLLKKIEELTLYVIEQNKIITKQNDRLSKLENLIQK